MPLNLKEPKFCFSQKRPTYYLILIQAMKRFTLLTALGLTLIGQSLAQPAKVLVLGTRHDGNAFLNHKVLLAELERLQPDVILRETHESFRRMPGLLLGSSLGILKPSVEQMALQKFTRRHRRI
jgi:hypothetical protein